MSDSRKQSQGYPAWALAGWDWLGDAQAGTSKNRELLADPDYESVSVHGETVGRERAQSAWAESGAVKHSNQPMHGHSKNTPV